MVRAASGLVIAVVVFKVFLFDMAALTGALRAASFLGLGAVLIVIGRLYQRLLMRGRTMPTRTMPTRPARSARRARLAAGVHAPSARGLPRTPSISSATENPSSSSAVAQMPQPRLLRRRENLVLLLRALEIPAGVQQPLERDLPVEALQVARPSSSPRPPGRARPGSPPSRPASRASARSRRRRGRPPRSPPGSGR